MQDLKLHLLETELHWENAQKNRAHFEQLINQVTEEIDVFILPEMFTTGFTMNPQNLSENSNGTTLTWMKEMSKRTNSALTGSIIVNDEGFRNRMYFVEPNGVVHYYDKRHLFSYAGEDKNYSAGKNRKIVEYLGWKILLQVCYDLRFPVFSRNNIEDGNPSYDLIIYVANWPDKRVYAWDSLLKARAIENISYVTGVNRKGKDGNEVEYSGHSQALDPLGIPLVSKNKTIELSSKLLTETRGKFKFLKDQDLFTLNT